MRSLRELCFAAIQRDISIVGRGLERKWGSRALTCAVVAHFFNASAAHLDFESMWLSQWDVGPLRVDELRVLNLRHTLVRPSILMQLHAPQLRCLMLEGVHGFTSLQHLEHFEQLQALAIEVDGVADDALQRLLVSLPRLQSLHLERATAVTSVEMFTALDALTLCDAVQLKRASLPHARRVGFHGCAALESLEVDAATHMSLRSCIALRHVELPAQLTHLQLLQCPRLRLDAFPLALRYLSLSSMKLDPVAELPPQLEELHVMHSKSFLPPPSLSQLPLRRLTLVNSVPIAPSATITRLTVTHCSELNDAGLSVLLLSVPALERLDLTACVSFRTIQLTSDVLRVFVAPDCNLLNVHLMCPNLKTLDLGGGSVFVSDTSTCLQRLRKLFAIGAKFVTDAWLVRVMRECADSLALLNCSETQLQWTTEHVRELVQWLPRLRRLYLNHCHVALTFDDAIALPTRVNMTAKHLSRHL